MQQAEQLKINVSNIRSSLLIGTKRTQVLKIRKELDLFANLRPALCFESMVEASSLKPHLVSGLDIMIVRELTGGVYFGKPRGIETKSDGNRVGINTQVYDCLLYTSPSPRDS